MLDRHLFEEKTPTMTNTSSPARRTVVQGAAWSVPIISIGASAPAVAASTKPSTVVGAQVSTIVFTSAAIDGLAFMLGFTTASTDGVIPAGTVMTHTLCTNKATAAPILLGSLTGVTFTSDVSAGTSVAAGSCITLTTTFTNATSTAAASDIFGAAYPSATELPSQTNIIVTSGATVQGDATAADPGVLVYTKGKRTPADQVNSPGRIPQRFVSRNGNQTYYPTMDFTSNSTDTAGQGWLNAVGYPTPDSIDPNARGTWSGKAVSSRAVATGTYTPLNTTAPQTNLPKAP